mgnify:CR=1 FL=1
MSLRTNKITSKPEHGAEISFDAEGKPVFASQVLQIFFDELQDKVNSLAYIVQGSATNMDLFTNRMDTYIAKMDSL